MLRYEIMFRNLFFAAFSLLMMVGVSCLNAGIAQAEVRTVDGVEINVPVPQGYCALDDQYPWDASQIRSFKRGRKGKDILLLFFADCERLNRVRKGEVDDVQRYGMVVAQIANGQTRFPNLTRKSLVTGAARGLKNVDLNEAFQDAKASIKKSFPGGRIKVSSMKSLGILHKDDNALYLGLAAKIQRRGATVDKAGVIALTLARTVLIRVQMYAPLKSNQVYKDLLGSVQTAVTSTIAANPEREGITQPASSVQVSGLGKVYGVSPLAWFIGALVPTFVLSRILLFAMRGWNGRWNRLLLAHFTSWIIGAFVGGMGLADGGAFAGAMAAGLYLVPQLVWLIVDIVRGEHHRAPLVDG